MTSPASAGPSATPPASRPRLHWSVAAPLTAAVGVGSAVLGVLTDLPLLGLAGAVVAAVPAVLASRRVRTLQAEVALDRAEAGRATARLAAEPGSAPVLRTTSVRQGGPVVQTALVRPFVLAPAASSRVDLTRAERAASDRPVVDLVKQVAAAPVAAVAPQHASVGRPVAAGSGDGAAVQTQHAAQGVARARVDTAELQLIWDLGEAPHSRTGRGRRVRTGAEVDALPDRPPHVPGLRRRARHRG